MLAHVVLAASLPSSSRLLRFISAMDPMNKVRRLVKEDIVDAARLARSIKDPWQRTLALAWVARFAESDALRLAREAEKAAVGCKDKYQRTAALAWVIAALAECDLGQEAKRVLHAAVERAPQVTPAASRAEALILLLQAATSLGPHSVRTIAEQLDSCCGQDHHWRCRRAIRDARRYLAGEIPPRMFFW